MAEIKNTFIKSKMNRDLDDRLIPKGEYRTALNVGISQTEGADVGTLQVVLGNLEINNIELEGAELDCNVKVIGVYTDSVNQKIYLYLTNFLDTNSVSNPLFSGDTNITPSILSAIVEFNKDGSYNILCKGSFLNFSLNSPILNIDLIEDLLFWTDDRNQPRKININTARKDPNYYRNEDLISVAKYYPWNPIKLVQEQVTSITVTNSGGPASPSYTINQIYNTTGGSGSGLTVQVISVGAGGGLNEVRIVDPGNGYKDGDLLEIPSKAITATIRLNMDTVSTMKDTCTPYLPPSAVSIATSTSGAGGPIVLTEDQTSDPLALFEELSGGVYPYNVSDDDLWVYNADVPSTGWNVVTQVSLGAGNEYQFTTINITSLISQGWSSGQTYYFAAKNPYYNVNWPGDCEYLKDKFVRFAYRFKFKDDEYSLISPFTQPVFQPKQYGYLTYPQEDNAVDSTEIEIAQNRITEVDLIIPCPDLLEGTVSNIWQNVENALGVDSIEIIYKDDNESNLKVLTEINVDSFSNNVANTLRYTYQSSAPFKVLPESELTRTSDVVPIKALTQSVAGNRVIYGNFLDKHSSILNLNYEVGAGEKEQASCKEYYNHSLKQNRTYQVGFVLSDRYGRKSDVVISSQDFEATFSASGITYGGSTQYHGYGATLIGGSPINTWCGDQLSILLNQVIPETGPKGYPGVFRGYDRVKNAITNLYAGDGTETPTTVPTIYNTIGGNGSGLQVQGTVDSNGYFNNDLLIVNFGLEYEDGDVITIVGDASPSTATFVYRPNIQPNLLGFSTCQVVVKQQEQEYYNVYLPGIVNGEINTSTIGESNTKAVVSLFSDNINKVPKDLLEVGPSQTNYNSSAQLYLRVENTITGNKQFNTDRTTQKVTQISELSDLGVNLTRHQQEVATPAGATTTWNLTKFDEDKVFPGSSVVVTDSSGIVQIDLTDDIYVIAYYATATGASVILNQDISLLFPAIAPGDTFTFGPPGVIYNGQNNPLIGILSTSENIGISEDNGFKPFLAVFETSPVKSNLDIYYETTTSLDIPEVNFNVRNSTTELGATDISTIFFELNESDCEDGIFVDATNFFFPLDQINTPIQDVNTVCSISSVTDGNGNPSSGWSLSTNGTGSFKIQSSEARYCGADSNAYTYDFVIKFNVNGIILTKQFVGTLSNASPFRNSVVSLPAFFQDNNRFPRRVTNPDKGYNGAGDITGVGKLEVNKKVISAVITGFTNADCGLPDCPDCENNNATQADFQYPTSTITNGLKLGMDCRSWFKWAPSNNSGVVLPWWNTFSFYIAPNTIMQQPIAPNPNDVLWFLGIPINNGTLFFDQGLGQNIAIYSTADICDNIEMQIVVETCDGTGACITETINYTVTRI